MDTRQRKSGVPGIGEILKFHKEGYRYVPGNLTGNAPENRPKPKRKHFQGLY